MTMVITGLINDAHDPPWTCCSNESLKCHLCYHIHVNSFIPAVKQASPNPGSIPKVSILFMAGTLSHARGVLLSNLHTSLRSQGSLSPKLLSILCTFSNSGV